MFYDETRYILQWNDAKLFVAEIKYGFIIQFIGERYFGRRLTDYAFGESFLIPKEYEI